MTDAAPLLRGFPPLAIQVRDLAAVERFYRDVLGLPVMRRWPRRDGAPGERSVWLDTGDGHGFLALSGGEGGPTADEDAARATRPGLHLVALRIEREARGAWEARLEAA